MRDLDYALAQINAIRSQMARGTQFRGYGPGSTAATGLLALMVALAQTSWSVSVGSDAATFVAVWVCTAVVALSISGWETIRRTQRLHFGFSREMIQSAVEQFVPALVAGMMLTVVIVKVAPHEQWMLPGLWQLIFSPGVFASCRFLPRPMFSVGVWYLVTGLACLAVEAGPRELSPWAMGIPFGIGQLLVAAVLKRGYDDSAEQQSAN